jgi:hypothetical protein
VRVKLMWRATRMNLRAQGTGHRAQKIKSRCYRLADCSGSDEV